MVWDKTSQNVLKIVVEELLCNAWKCDCGAHCTGNRYHFYEKEIRDSGFISKN